MGKHLDLIGQRYGRLIVVQKTGFTNAGKRLWSCRCDCGVVVEVSSGSLRSGNNVSCGCYRRDLTRARSTTHGHFVNYKRSPEHESWRAMKSRCLNPNDANYKYYGGRGITICKAWMMFARFLKDVGKRPEGMTLDRIDNDKGYEPGNVRWSTPEVQSRNRRHVKAPVE